MLKVNSKKNQSGFTIVELLIVIVVIAILATISVVAYNGIQQRASKSTLSSALTTTAKRLELDRVTRGSYPAKLADIEGGIDSGGNDIDYQYNSSAQEYCLTATLRDVAMHIQSSKTAVDGVCVGHDAPGPVTDPVVHVQTELFNQNMVNGGLNITSDINFDLLPTDYVFVIFNAEYNTLIDAKIKNGADLNRLYERSQGVSGYQKHIAFGIGGLTGRQSIDLHACWYMSCGDYNPTLTASYTIYVIRGLGSSPNITTTNSSSYTSQPNNTVVSVPTQALAKRKLAIYSYVFFGNNHNSIIKTDASDPALNWIVDHDGNNSGTSKSVATRHAYAERSTTVGFTATMPSSGGQYYGAVLFTFQ